MSANDGGPAFPTLETERFHPTDGMSLRDYFATHAFSAISMAMASAMPEPMFPTPELLAELAYQHADAMLVQRAKAGDGVA